MTQFRCIFETEYEPHTKVISEKDILSIKPGNESFLVVNYYDDEYCMPSTYFCNKIEIITDKDKISF